MLSRLLSAALLGALASCAAAPIDAAAATAPCVPETAGPSCAVWTGKLTNVGDADTVDVDLAGDGTRRSVRIRVTGIQAMEQSVYSRTPSRRRGACHALAATARVDRLVRASRGRVRVAAQDPSSRAGRRLRRAVAFRIGGRWVDLGATLIAEGHALWLPHGVEWAWNRQYLALARAAATQARNLWDVAYCRPGPSQSSPLSLGLRWDAAGVDGHNPNGEWIRIRNHDTRRAISVAGWHVRDSALRSYRFPSWARIPAGGAITVHVGRGRSAGTRFHWGLPGPAFENASRDARGMGDGAYLFDRHGDLRAWQMYG